MRIGVDIGGTKIAAGIVDDSGIVVASKRIPTEKEQGYDAVVKRIVLLLNELMQEAGVSRKEVEKIGIASAGQIDKVSGRIIFSPNLDWRDVPLRDDIKRVCEIMTTIENDVNASTYGEWRFGLKESSRNVLGVFVGTGIGGGFILEGSAYRGFSNVGGEVGHITLNPYGYPCHCGNSGCFEAFCGGSYVVERVRKRVREGYRGKIWDIIEGNDDMLHTGHIETACLMGDDLCKTIWQEVIEYMGAGMASLVNLLNPEVLILGGGVVNGTKYFVEKAGEAMARRALGAPLKGLRIVKAQLGDNAAIVGAPFME